MNCRPGVDDLEYNIETATHEISKSGYIVSIEANLYADKDNETKKKLQAKPKHMILTGQILKKQQ